MIDNKSGILYLALIDRGQIVSIVCRFVVAKKEVRIGKYKNFFFTIVR